MGKDKSILGYKQAPGCKVWETIPTLTLKKVVDTTNPEDNGLKDGSKDWPPANSPERAETENRILFQAEEYLANVNDLANKEMTDLGRQIDEHALNHEDTFTDLTASAEKEFQHYLLEAHPELQHLRVEERQQLRYFKLFKAKNNIDRLASYPESRWFHAGLIALIVLVECLANTYFFAAGSELGLLGGFFQASLISCVNVAFCLLVGRMALSNMHHVNRWRRSAGGAAFLLWMVSALAYHLLVAHYRDMLAVDVDGALVGAVGHFVAAPFQLQSLDSILVLAVGCVVSIIALIDGYKLDDPYPGYGEEDRKYKKNLQAYRAKEKEVRARLAAGVRETEQHVAERMRVYKENHAKTNDLFNGAVSVVDHFSNIYSQVDEVVGAAINNYRAANRKIRTDADPLSFAVTPKAKRMIEVEKFHHHIEQFRDVRDNSARLLEKMHRYCTQVQASLKERAETMLERIEQLAEDIRSKADREIIELNQEV